MLFYKTKHRRNLTGAFWRQTLRSRLNFSNTVFLHYASERDSKSVKSIPSIILNTRHVERVAQSARNKKLSARVHRP